MSLLFCKTQSDLSIGVQLCRFRSDINLLQHKQVIFSNITKYLISSYLKRKTLSITQILFQNNSKVFSAKFIQSPTTLNTIKQRLSIITQVFSAKFIQSTKQIINKLCLKLGMRTTRTPEIHYFEHGWIKFSTSRKDNELYYEISKWNDDATILKVIEEGKVNDQEHLNILQKYDGQ